MPWQPKLSSLFVKDLKASLSLLKMTVIMPLMFYSFSYKRSVFQGNLFNYLLDLRKSDRNVAPALEKFTLWGATESLNSSYDFGVSSVQFSSVTQSCPTLCDPMNHSTPGLPVHHQLLESTQTHVHCVGDAIQPYHSLLSPFPPAFNPSEHQGIFK